MFSVDDAGVLTAITNHIAVALETARAAQLEVAVATANRQRDVAETVRDALAEITGHLGGEPVQVLRRLLGTARRVTHDDQAWLVLSTVDNAEQVQVIAGDRGTPSPMDTDAPLRALLGADGPVSDATSSDGARPALVGGLEHWLAVPLIAPRERLGLLLLASPEPTAFAQGRAEIVNALADKAVVAYENARLFEQVRRMATTDGLTGLANRSHLFESAERAFGAARRGGRRIAAMMIDVDHFKQVNDTYGHRIGDEVLAAMAERLRRAVRGHDLLGRYGGEEFAVVLVDATDSAHAAAERLREAVAASPFPTGVGPLDMTVSIGVTHQHDGDVTLSDMLARADLCLLGAKRAGRNRVRSA
jgi:diguanylate cyclase (GGDEF)-like protein